MIERKPWSYIVTSDATEDADGEQELYATVVGEINPEGLAYSVLTILKLDFKWTKEDLIDLFDNIPDDIVRMKEDYNGTKH